MVSELPLAVVQHFQLLLTSRGCLSLLIPIITKQDSEHNENLLNLCDNVIKVARDSVDATPVIALTPLFRSVVASGRYVTESQGEDMLTSLQTITNTLFAILDEENTSLNWVYMLHEICKLIFSPKLLRDEYQTASINGNKNHMPIVRAFGKLFKMAGTTKPHICKTAVSIISSAWLGEEGSREAGILAIPYRDHIINLLLYKEGKVDDSALHQSSYQVSVEGLLPKSTDASSITRAFVLVFLSKLPPLESISDTVLNELVHYIIDGLLDIGCKGPVVGKPFITGSEECKYVLRDTISINSISPHRLPLSISGTRCTSYSIVASVVSIETVHNREQGKTNCTQAL